jgi:hypothetical protein
MGLLDRIRNKGRPDTPQDADRLVLRQLESLGSDLTRPRHVVHYLYFPAEEPARAAAEVIDGAGYTTVVEPPNDRIAEWCVKADTTRVVNAATVEAFRAWFEHVAAEHDGEYDAWEAAKKP